METDPVYGDAMVQLQRGIHKVNKQSCERRCFLFHGRPVNLGRKKEGAGQEGKGRAGAESLG